MRGAARAAAAARSGGLRAAAGRGLDLATTIGDTVGEAARSRRDPSLVAERRRVAARRRMVVWSLCALVLAALSATGLVDAIDGDVSATSIGALVLMLGLLLYCLLGVARAGIDLRARTLAVRRLPPPQPARRPVTAAIRPLIGRLDGYSDALREVIGSVGVQTAGSSAGSGDIRTLRHETLAAADAAETRLRAQAAELTALLRGGAPAGGGLRATADQLTQQITAGVDEYGRLVAAASDAAAASRALTTPSRTDGAVAQATDQLTALATGMREVAASGRAGG